MTDQLKISIITPSFNSVKFIEDAIQSVLQQDYPVFEHIVVDGGSTDGTVEILKKYAHLRWVSEPDKGQSDAMNKGFRMSDGDIIVYLNADDFFLPGAFHRVIPYFHDGAKFVIGTVRVEKEDGRYWINDARITHDEMLKHWEDNAFCVNPVGYFYRREVQENVPPFNHDNHYAMDLEFLLECSLRYNFTKVLDKEPLGVFRYHQQTKTSQQNENLSELFSLGNYRFIDKFLVSKSEHYRKKYHQLRLNGYLKRINKHNGTSLDKNMVKSRRRKNKLILKYNDFRKSDNKMEIIHQFIIRKFSGK